MDRKNRNAIIAEIYSGGMLDELLKNMGIKENDFEDLKQELSIILLEYDEEKIITMYEKKQLKFFLVKVIQFQYFSATSPFYKKYKKYYQFIDGNIVNNDTENEEQHNECDE